MNAVSLRGVTRAYGTTPVLRGVDLDVASGTFAAILGVSGCGKSTLMRLIAGFDHVDSGTIDLGSVRVDDGHRALAPERRRVGYVPQEGALFPHLDVRANVAFGLPRRERGQARVDELLDLVGIGGLQRHRPHELSGGQQQRVALARALATRPDVILLDEPFSALDPGLRAETRAEVRRAVKALGTTALLVTHDQDEALSCADLVAVLRDGIIVQAAAPRELYHAPCDVPLACFLGEANVVPATIEDGVAQTPLGPVRLRDAAGEGARGVVVLRPEELTLTATGPDAGAANAEVGAVEFYGHDARIELRLDDPAGALPLIVRTGGHDAPEVGQRVLCAVGADGHFVGGGHAPDDLGRGTVAAV